MASIRPKGRGFEARIHSNGRSVSRTFHSQEAASAWASAVEQGYITAQTRSSAVKMTFVEACNQYEREVIPSHKGARQELSRLRHMRALPFASKDLSKVTPEDLKTYRDRLIAQNLSGSSVRLNLALISAVFNYAKREWAVQAENPVAAITKPRVGKSRTRRLEPGEESRLMDSLAKCKNLHVKRVVIFLLQTGVRKSEALNLQWSDIDTNRQTVILRDTKNGTSRWIPLSFKAIEELKQHAFTYSKPFPITGSCLDQAWQHAVKRAGIKNLRVHDLRHEALSRWADVLAGDLFKLQSISGHKSVSMLGRYVHPVIAGKLADALDTNKVSD